MASSKTAAYYASVTLAKESTVVATAMNCLECALGKRVTFHWVWEGTSVKILVEGALPQGPLKFLKKTVTNCIYNFRGFRFSTPPAEVSVSVARNTDKRRVAMLQGATWEDGKAKYGHSSKAAPWDLSQGAPRKSLPRRQSPAQLMWSWFDGLSSPAELTRRDIVERYVASCVELRAPCDGQECAALVNTLWASIGPQASASVVDSLMSQGLPDESLDSPAGQEPSAVIKAPPPQAPAVNKAPPQAAAVNKAPPPQAAAVNKAPPQAPAVNKAPPPQPTAAVIKAPPQAAAVIKAPPPQPTAAVIKAPPQEAAVVKAPPPQPTAAVIKAPPPQAAAVDKVLPESSPLMTTKEPGASAEDTEDTKTPAHPCVRLNKADIMKCLMSKGPGKTSRMLDLLLQR
jgi:hypothetical protein